MQCELCKSDAKKIAEVFEDINSIKTIVKAFDMLCKASSLVSFKNFSVLKIAWPNGADRKPSDNHERGIST